MLPYEYARLIVRSEGIQTKEEYQDFIKKFYLETCIPFDPGIYYSKWQGWGDFLGVFNAEEFKRTYKDKVLSILSNDGGLAGLKKRKRGSGFGV